MTPTSKSPTPANAPAGEKLQKVLARAGYGSRRQLEAWIEASRVSVNGKTAGLGDRVSVHDQVRVDGRLIPDQTRVVRRTRVLMYHKPAGEICARRDPEGRRTVFESLPGVRNGRWVMVGRLDIATSGLLLFTSDGELANQLMHPSSQVEREYAVRVLGEPDTEALRALTDGITLDGQVARFSSLKRGGGEGANQWYRVTLAEGRYREVRRLWESQGLVVSRLIRVRYGVLELPRALRAGQWLELDADVVAELSGRDVAPTVADGDDTDTTRDALRPARKRGAVRGRDSASTGTTVAPRAASRRGESIKKAGRTVATAGKTTAVGRKRTIVPDVGAKPLPGQRRRGGPPKGKSPRR